MAKERAFRIAVVEADRRLSAIWRIWGNKDDIYVAARSLASEFKTSLHASGVFRHAFVTDASSAKHRGSGADRAVAKWRRPAAQAQNGALLFQILLPGSELQATPNDEALPADLIRVSRPPANTVLYVSIIQLAAAARGTSPRFEVDTECLTAWDTASGDTVWITAHLQPFDGDQRQRIADLRSELLLRTASLSLRNREGNPPMDLRAFATIDSPDQVGRVVEIGAEFVRVHRVRERAYFLYENRTGNRWWDPVSNWLEAELIEVGPIQSTVKGSRP